MLVGAADGYFGITTGMLGTEIARMINPGVTGEIQHLLNMGSLQRHRELVAVGEASQRGHREAA